jgi:hypothetical protein
MNHHDMADDMADFGSRMNVSEGGLRIDTHRPIPKGCDYQGRWPQAAEAATELGAEDYDKPHVSGAIAWPVFLVIAICAVAAAWHVAGVLA